MRPVCPSPGIGRAARQATASVGRVARVARDGSDCRSQPKYRIVSAALQGRAGFRAIAAAIGVAAVAAAFAAAQAGADTTTKPALTRALQAGGLVLVLRHAARPRTSRSPTKTPSI